MHPNPTGNNTHPFYSVSLGKLSLLYFATNGLYAYFWCYRLWRDVELQTGRVVFPALRSVFAVFFVHELFAYIKKQDESKGSTRKWNASGLAWFFIFAQISQLLFFLLFFELGWGMMAGFVAGVIAIILQFVPIYQVQLAVNRTSNDAFGENNGKITLENQLWMAFGAFLWVKHFLYGLQPVPTPEDPLGTVDQDRPTVTEQLK